MLKEYQFDNSLYVLFRLSLSVSIDNNDNQINIFEKENEIDINHASRMINK